MNSEELVQLRRVDSGRPDAGAINFSFDQFRVLHEDQDVLEDVAAFGKVTAVVTVGGSSDEAVLEYVSGNYFSLLGLTGGAGRTLNQDDDQPGSAVAVVLSNAFWRSRFGSDPSAVGSSIQIDGVRALVVGIAPPGYDGYLIDWNGPTNLWVALGAAATLGRGAMLSMPVPFFAVLGRIQGRQNRAELETRLTSWHAALPAARAGLIDADRIALVPLDERRIGRRAQAKRFLDPLLVVSLLLTTTAALNFLNALLGDFVTRTRNDAIRMALGAKGSFLRAAFLGELLCHGLLVAAFGLAAAALFVRILAPLPPTYLELPPSVAALSTEAAFDGTLILGVTLAGITATMISGFLAALVSPTRRIDARNSPAAWTWSRVRFSARANIVVAQACLSVTLLGVGAVLLRDVNRLASVNPGVVAPEKILLAKVIPAGLSRAARRDFYRSLEERIGAEPGVDGVALGINPPFLFGTTAVGTSGSSIRSTVEVRTSSAGPGFFALTGARVLGGQEFLTFDDEPTGIVINKVLADALWPGASAIGKTVTYRDDEHRVVGVVDLVRCGSLRTERESCVWRQLSLTTNSIHVYVRVRDPDADVLRRLRAVASDLHPTAAVTQVRLLSTQLEGLQAPERVTAKITAILGTLALSLLLASCISTFRALIYESRPSLALRMAVGATPRSLVLRIVSHAAVLLMVGALAGVGLSLEIAPRLSSISETQLGTVETVIWAPLLTIGIGALVVLRTSLTLGGTAPHDALRSL